MVVTITKRKIGPGLKTFLKFKVFSNPHHIQIRFQPTSIIQTHLCRLPFDAELFKIIIDHFDGRWSNRSKITNNWLIPHMPKMSLIEVAITIAATPHYTSDFLNKTRVVDLVRSTIIDQSMDDSARANFIIQMAQHNGYEGKFKHTEAIDFALRNIVDIKVRSQCIHDLTNCFRFQGSHNAAGKYRQHGFNHIARQIFRAFNAGLITDYPVDRIIHAHSDVFKYRVVGESVVMEIDDT
jgi:hypothetical protein